MEREIIRTADGSTTIRIPEWDECYHSKNGAIQEALHVFIKNGLSTFKGKPVSILEIGFGTGLNAFITYLESVKNHQVIDYVGIEGFPVPYEEWSQMNYVNELAAESEKAIFEKMHDSSWEVANSISPDFMLTKVKLRFQDIAFADKFDLIYFDAFGFAVQPELWDVGIFSIMYRALKSKGMLVTYAARSIIKKNMQQNGFLVKKLAGPPGKREMMVGFKNYCEEDIVN